MQLFIKKHAFSLLLLAAVGLAFALPQPAAENGFLLGSGITKLSVAVIFFLQGLTLPTQTLTAGCRPLRLHGFVLLWNFVCFPMVTFTLLYPVIRLFPTELFLGFGALAFLPTTIASSAAYTEVSGGTVASAIVSAALSNLLAIFVLPTVSVVFFSLDHSIQIPVGKVLLSLTCLLTIPLLLGQTVQRLAGIKTDRATRITHRITTGIILFIVYQTFSKSIRSGVFELLSLELLSLIVLAVLVLLLGASFLVWKSAVWLELKMPQRIAAFYCGSQKSLATGLPLVSSILLAAPDMKNATMVFIPLLCFHPLQMLLAGIVAPLIKSTAGATTAKV